MRALKRSEKRLLVFTPTVAIVMLLYVDVVEPRVQRGTALLSRIQTVEQDLAETRSLIRHRDEILAHSEALQKQIASIGDEDLEMKALFQEIDRLATAANLSPQSLRPRESKDYGFYRLFSAELLVEGSSRDVARFLHSLGDASQLLRVDRLQMNALRTPGLVRAEFLIVKILSPRTGG